MKRILVAGSTGYLGGFVCRELKARGHFVRALARSPEKLVPLRDSLDEIVEAETDVVAPPTGSRTLEGHFEGSRGMKGKGTAPATAHLNR